MSADTNEPRQPDTPPAKAPASDLAEYQKVEGE